MGVDVVWYVCCGMCIFTEISYALSVQHISGILCIASMLNCIDLIQ